MSGMKPPEGPGALPPVEIVETSEQIFLRKIDEIRKLDELRPIALNIPTDPATLAEYSRRNPTYLDRVLEFLKMEKEIMSCTKTLQEQTSTDKAFQDVEAGTQIRIALGAYLATENITNYERLVEILSQVAELNTKKGKQIDLVLSTEPLFGREDAAIAIRLGGYPLKSEEVVKSYEFGKQEYAVAAYVENGNCVLKIYFRSEMGERQWLLANETREEFKEE